MRSRGKESPGQLASSNVALAEGEEMAHVPGRRPRVSSNHDSSVKLDSHNRSLEVGKDNDEKSTGKSATAGRRRRGGDGPAEPKLARRARPQLVFTATDDQRSHQNALSVTYASRECMPAQEASTGRRGEARRGDERRSSPPSPSSPLPLSSGRSTVVLHPSRLVRIGHDHPAKTLVRCLQ